MKKLYQTKNPELITSSNKITPPPPNSHKNHINKGSLPKQFAIIAIVAVSAIIPLIDCSLPDDSQDAIITPLAITVTEVPKRTNTDVRDSYVLFSIKANRNVSNYHLAVKKEIESASTAAEMTTGALKRNLSTNSINVLIAQHLDAPMVGFVKANQADKTHTTLGSNMQSIDSANGYINLAYDNTATGDNAWVSRSVLEPSTDYTLYGMMALGTEVKTLATFTTDATAARGSAAGTETHRMLDTTLEKDHISITVNPNDYYIFPLQGDLNSSIGTIGLLTLYFDSISKWSMAIQSPLLIPVNNGKTPENHSFFMMNNRIGSVNEDTQQGLYLMMYPSSEWASSLGIIVLQYNTGLLYKLNYSQLVKQ